MLDKLIFTLNEEEINANPIFHGFYSLIGKKLGYVETPDSAYDCRKICIAQNIQDKCYEYYEKLGNDPTSISMHLCLSGPKVEKTLKDNQVSIEAGYITEKNAAIQFTVGYEIPHPQSIDVTCATTSGEENVEKGLNEFTVQIILSELTIVAESPERAEEIAIDIYNSDARTHLTHGLSIETCEVYEQGPAYEDSETEV